MKNSHIRRFIHISCVKSCFKFFLELNSKMRIRLLIKLKTQKECASRSLFYSKHNKTDKK